MRTTLIYALKHTQVAFLLRELNPGLPRGAKGINANYQKQKMKNTVIFKGIISTWSLRQSTFLGCAAYSRSQCCFLLSYASHLMNFVLNTYYDGHSVPGAEGTTKMNEMNPCLLRGEDTEARTIKRLFVRLCRVLTLQGQTLPSREAHTGMIHPSWGVWGRFPREVRFQMSSEDALVHKKVEHAENVIKVGV